MRRLVGGTMPGHCRQPFVRSAGWSWPGTRPQRSVRALPPCLPACPLRAGKTGAPGSADRRRRKAWPPAGSCLPSSGCRPAAGRLAGRLRSWA